MSVPGWLTESEARRSRTSTGRIPFPQARRLALYQHRAANAQDIPISGMPARGEAFRNAFFSHAHGWSSSMDAFASGAI